MKNTEAHTPDRSWSAMELAEAYSASVDATSLETQHIQCLLLCAGQHIYSEAGPGRWEGFHALRFFKQWPTPAEDRREDGQRLIGFFSWMVRGRLITVEDAVPIVAAISEVTEAKIETLEPPTVRARLLRGTITEPRLWEHVRREGLSRVHPIARKFANSTQTIKRKRITAEWVITKLMKHIGEQPLHSVDPGFFCFRLRLRSGQSGEVGKILCDFYLWHAKAGAISADDAIEVVEMALIGCPGLAEHGERTLERLRGIPQDGFALVA